MKNNKFILKTKLTPPQLKTQILHKAELTKKLKRMKQYKMTLVHSGPGYGKSTALASYLHSEPGDFSWYSAGTHDDDLIPFVHYLICSLRSIQPTFGAELLDIISDEEPYTRSNDILNLCETFINELLLLPEGSLLVIDDYHLVGSSDAINTFMNYLIQHLPGGFHLVVVSRTGPGWDYLTTLKVRGDLLELDEKDLSFSAEEIEVLFTDYYEYELKPEEAIQIYNVTEGWVIAVQLIWQRLMLDGSDVATVLSNYSDTMGDLFRFLAMEVLMKQTSSIQHFLERTSVLEDLNADVCNYLLSTQDSQDIIDVITTHNLFIVNLGEGYYRYHGLFRDFLLSQLARKNELFVELNRKAAEYYVMKNAELQALSHLETIEEWERYSELLQNFGKMMLEKGQLEGLLEKINRLPKEYKDRSYLLWIYEGDIYRYRSAYDLALECYVRGEKLANAARDSLSHSFGLEGQARIYLDTIQPGKAEALLTQAIDLLESLDDCEQEHLIRQYSLMAENLINLGRAVDAEVWYERCRSLQHDFQEELLEARLHLRTGRLKQSKKIIELIKSTESLQGEHMLPRSHREADILLSLIEAMLGEPEEAKRLAQQGMLQGIQLKAPFVEACGWMRLGHAAQLLPKYDFSVALTCYQTALDIMERLNVSRGRAEPLMGLGLLYAREGLHDTANQYSAEALAETEKVKDEWLSTLIRLGIGISFYYEEEYGKAGVFFAECYERFMQCGDSYGLTVTLLWQALLAYHEERRDDFLVYMERFLKQAQTGQYDFLIQKRTLFGPRNIEQLAPLLIEAQKQDIQSHYVNVLLTKLGLEQLTYHPGYTLRIETLGDFKVWLGNKPIVEKNWQRGKAKELFQLLVNKRDQLVPKEEIITLLFGELLEKAANRDFKVALNALNTTLEPQRRARSTPFFIQRHGSAYGLNLASGLELDVIEFESWIRSGLEEKDTQKAIHSLERGLALYKGDYMPDRRYEDWSIEERERLQVLYLRGAERLVHYYWEQKRCEEAVHYCEQILEKDACWEEAYRLLMLCHCALGNRNLAIKWYQKCVRVLERELGVKPMTTTTQLYESLLASDVTHL
ncbi:BTAD domain-containing putative transcriptional regulator [Paenibacillus sediminis]|uniref:ATP/maltotriose-dependent transcriptional regulator MalT/two-component SAPR family response regulator n=1 Tax=Paenibacillus sediminis TaxID=664909 RepID=A0ABS4H0Z6_9BACL|nr:BTAD domain-containing putative transcriptional regulator [Paenibacillus sediminis]MBP1936141.1 ATP/maltotriose-dependent transcriptional regulator MalT/two-component SAPR family response regulator [Paenibacillus sediminis]